MEYSLTEVGWSLKLVLDALWSWGEGDQKRMAGDVEGEA